MPEASLLFKITLFNIPKTKKRIKSLLGLFNFYTPFVSKYAEIVACLMELTARSSTSNHIKWSYRHDEALLNIQITLSSKQFLQIPDLSLDIYVFTVSSSIVLAICLCQLNGNQYLPTRFTSRTLSPPEAK